MDEQVGSYKRDPKKCCGRYPRKTCIVIGLVLVFMVLLLVLLLLFLYILPKALEDSFKNHLELDHFQVSEWTVFPNETNQLQFTLEGELTYPKPYWGYQGHLHYWTFLTKDKVPLFNPQPIEVIHVSNEEPLKKKFKSTFNIQITNSTYPKISINDVLNEILYPSISGGSSKKKEKISLHTIRFHASFSNDQITLYPTLAIDIPAVPFQKAMQKLTPDSLENHDTSFLSGLNFETLDVKMTKDGFSIDLSYHTKGLSQSYLLPKGKYPIYFDVTPLMLVDLSEDLLLSKHSDTIKVNLNFEILKDYSLTGEDIIICLYVGIKTKDFLLNVGNRITATDNEWNRGKLRDKSVPVLDVSNLMHELLKFKQSLQQYQFFFRNLTVIDNQIAMDLHFKFSNAFNVAAFSLDFGFKAKLFYDKADFLEFSISQISMQTDTDNLQNLFMLVNVSFPQNQESMDTLFQLFTTLTKDDENVDLYIIEGEFFLNRTSTESNFECAWCTTLAEKIPSVPLSKSTIYKALNLNSSWLTQADEQSAEPSQHFVTLSGLDVTQRTGSPKFVIIADLDVSSLGFHFPNISLPPLTSFRMSYKGTHIASLSIENIFPSDFFSEHLISFKFSLDLENTDDVQPLFAEIMSSFLSPKPSETCFMMDGLTLGEGSMSLKTFQKFQILLPLTYAATLLKRYVRIDLFPHSTDFSVTPSNLDLAILNDKEFNLSFDIGFNKPLSLAFHVEALKFQIEVPEFETFQINVPSIDFNNGDTTLQLQNLNIKRISKLSFISKIGEILSKPQVEMPIGLTLCHLQFGADTESRPLKSLSKFLYTVDLKHHKDQLPFEKDFSTILGKLNSMEFHSITFHKPSKLDTTTSLDIDLDLEYTLESPIKLSMPILSFDLHVLGRKFLQFKLIGFNLSHGKKLKSPVTIHIESYTEEFPVDPSCVDENKKLMLFCIRQLSMGESDITDGIGPILSIAQRDMPFLLKSIFQGPQIPFKLEKMEINDSQIHLVIHVEIKKVILGFDELEGRFSIVSDEQQDLLYLKFRVEKRPLEENYVHVYKIHASIEFPDLSSVEWIEDAFAFGQYNEDSPLKKRNALTTPPSQGSFLKKFLRNSLFLKVDTLSFKDKSIDFKVPFHKMEKPIQILLNPFFNQEIGFPKVIENLNSFGPFGQKISSIFSVKSIDAGYFEFPNAKGLSLKSILNLNLPFELSVSVSNISLDITVDKNPAIIFGINEIKCESCSKGSVELNVFLQFYEDDKIQTSWKKFTNSIIADGGDSSVQVMFKNLNWKLSSEKKKILPHLLKYSIDSHTIKQLTKSNTPVRTNEPFKDDPQSNAISNVLLPYFQEIEAKVNAMSFSMSIDSGVLVSVSFESLLWSKSKIQVVQPNVSVLYNESSNLDSLNKPISFISNFKLGNSSFFYNFNMGSAIHAFSFIQVNIQDLSSGLKVENIVGLMESFLMSFQICQIDFQDTIENSPLMLKAVFKHEENSLQRLYTHFIIVLNEEKGINITLKKHATSNQLSNFQAYIIDMKTKEAMSNQKIYWKKMNIYPINVNSLFHSYSNLQIQNIAIYIDPNLFFSKAFQSFPQINWSQIFSCLWSYQPTLQTSSKELKTEPMSINAEDKSGSMLMEVELLPTDNLFIKIEHVQFEFLYVRGQEIEQRVITSTKTKTISNANALRLQSMTKIEYDKDDLNLNDEETNAILSKLSDLNDPIWILYDISIESPAHSATHISILHDVSEFTTQLETYQLPLLSSLKSLLPSTLNLQRFNPRMIDTQFSPRIGTSLSFSDRTVPSSMLSYVFRFTSKNIGVTINKVKLEVSNATLDSFSNLNVSATIDFPTYQLLQDLKRDILTILAEIPEEGEKSIAKEISDLLALNLNIEGLDIGNDQYLEFDTPTPVPIRAPALDFVKPLSFSKFLEELATIEFHSFDIQEVKESSDKKKLTISFEGEYTSPIQASFDIPAISLDVHIFGYKYITLNCSNFSISQGDKKKFRLELIITNVKSSERESKCTTMENVFDIVCIRNVSIGSSKDTLKEIKQQGQCLTLSDHDIRAIFKHVKKKSANDEPSTNEVQTISWFLTQQIVKTILQKTVIASLLSPKVLEEVKKMDGKKVTLDTLETFLTGLVFAISNDELVQLINLSNELQKKYRSDFEG
ncbi:hypothetical protein HMI54_012262 [Coelomomyces lativittatus]|nr:hypothetical protein HMI56_006428 [Coelomomyces lativittatus]KAJ1513162.1 hypothetical protein HMI55_005848 [Coelomomyces lativittatus]KAJ1515491.1 hypothetical protein HMI54_012262 [Coelomomyces lativittatus]